MKLTLYIASLKRFFRRRSGGDRTGISRQSKGSPKQAFLACATGALLVVSFVLFNPQGQPQNVNAYRNLYGSYLKGIFYAEEGDYKEAVTQLEKVKTLDKESIYVRLKIASIYIRTGEIDRAEKELKEAKAIDPDNYDASLALVFLYSYAQKDKELESEYEDFLKKAHKAKPNDDKITAYLAQLYFYKKQTKDAIALYETIIKNNPNHVDSLFWLGNLYEESGRHPDAIAMWKKALAVDPNHANSLNSLGYVYADDNINLDEALKLVTKALEKEPENGAFLDTLGWVYFKMKEYAKAEAALKKAISLAADPVIYEHLGDVLAAENKIDEAVKYYQEGLTKFPDNQKLKQKIEAHGKKSAEPKN